MDRLNATVAREDIRASCDIHRARCHGRHHDRLRHDGTDLLQ